MSTVPPTSWERRLLAAHGLRQSVWEQQAQEVANHFDGMDEEGNDLRHFYNKHLAADRNMMAAVAPRRIEVEATPDQPDQAAFARVMESAVKHNFTRARLRQVTRDWIYYGFEWGVGILYSQWGRHGAFNPVVRPDGQPAMGKPTDKRKDPFEDPHPQVQEAIRQSMPGPGVGEDWCKYWVIHPKLFLVNPECTSLPHAQWAGHGMWVPKEQVHAWAKRGAIDAKAEELHYQPLFEDGPSVESRATQVATELLEAWHRDDTSEGRELWQVWHVFDFVKQTYLLILPGMSKPLIERRNDIGNPYVDFRPASTPLAFWSKPPAWSYLQTNHTLDDLIETLVDYGARFGKTVGVFSEEEDTAILKQFAEAQGAEFFQARNPEAFKSISLSDLPPALMNLIPILNQLITETSGMSEVSSGVVSKGDVTATEIERNVAFQSLRLQIVKQIFDDSLQLVAERTAFLLGRFKTQRSLIPLLGIDVKHWQPDERQALLGQATLGTDGAALLPVDPLDVRGTYLFRVRAGDSAEEQKLADRKQAMDLLTILLPHAAAMGLNVLPLLTKILEMLGLDPQLVTANASPAPNPEMMGQPMPSVGRGPRQQQSKGRMPMNRDQMDRGGMPTDAGQNAITRRTG